MELIIQLTCINLCSLVPDLNCCMEILGFDIMIDKKFKPWLIEVNQSPSFATDSPLDYKTKKAVLTDTFKMLNCSVGKRKKLQ